MSHAMKRRGPCSSLALPGALLGVCLASCAVGPNFHRPPPPAVKAYLPEDLPARTVEVPGATGAAQRFVPEQEIAADWWKAFKSDELDALIREAVKANPNLNAARASLHQAQELAAAQRGAYWPQVQAGFSASRQLNATGVLSPTLSSGEPIFNLFTPQVTVSFVPDLLGGNRRQVESLLATADAARFQLDAAYLTLIDNLVVTAVQIAGLQEQLRATERVVSSYRESLEVLRHSLSLGAVAEIDVASQETALAQAEATLAPLRHQLEVQRHQLAVLTGHVPAEPPAVTLELDRLQLPQEIPISVPSRLVEHRPDVLAAEAQLHAATAQVGVAIADMLPQLTLTGSAGTTATIMADLFKDGTRFWSGGASLTQTLFEGGTLWHKTRAAEAALDQAGATYRATVLTAFQNVADTLHALTSDAETLQAYSHAAQAAENAFRITRRQLDLGSVNYLALLVAEQNYLQTQVSLIGARMNRLADTAALFQALGGAPLTTQAL
jgi:NodT family efflux transporter outer membrane factor (OMF) lipoprotein